MPVEHLKRLYGKSAMAEVIEAAVREAKPADVNRLGTVRADDSPREGGQWKGRVRIAEDFDTLPDDLAAAFGIDPS